MLSLKFRAEGCLVSGMAMPPASQFGIGFAMARETRLLVIANIVIVTNRIVEEWTKGRWLKHPPTNLYNRKMSIFAAVTLGISTKRMMHASG
jgi:hypothetical protein